MSTLAAIDPSSVAMMVTTGGAAVAALFAWLTTRDKLRYDATLVKLQTEYESLRLRADECTKARDQLAARDDRQQVLIDSLRAELGAVWQRVHARDVAHPLTDETGGHEPAGG